MLYSILIILYLVVFAVLAWKNLKWAIYLIIFGLPSYLIRFNFGPLPMTLLEGMILIIFLVFIIKEVIGRKLKGDIKYLISNIKYFLVFVGLFLLAATISVFVGPDLRAALGMWKAYFVEPILFLVVFVWVIKKEDFKNIFYALAGSTLVVSAVAIYQKITGDLIANEFWAEEATRRVSGVFPYPNALALYLAPIIILLIGFWVGQKREKNKLLNYYIVKLLGWGIVALGLLSIYWSGSKGAMLGILAGLIFYTLFYKGYRKYFGVVVLVSLIIGAVLVQSGKINLKGNYSVEGGDSISVRQEMWAESWQMIKDRPIFGAGLGGYQTVMKNYHERKYIEIYLYPHNIFLNFWSEIGLLGLFAFLGILVWFYGRGFTKQNKDLRFKIYDLRIPAMAAMTVVIAHGLVDVPYFKNDLSVFLWLLIGLVIVESVGQKQELKV